MFGFLNVYKPQGLTSFDVVARVRKIFNIRQVGHTGTLDPFATGVLPICLGKATKLIEYLPDDKEYVATVQFGANTDTYDLEGEVIARFEKKVSKIDVVSAIKNFEGEIEQIPPIYSAIKVNGKKLYEYARKGQEVEIKSRKVNIYQIKLLDFDSNAQTARIKVACSKGTYIRSIAYDLGKILGCGGYLIKLERTKAGAFHIENSVKLESLTSENMYQYLINPADILQGSYALNEVEYEHVIHGRSILTPHPSPLPKREGESYTIVFFIYGGSMVGVGQVEEDKIKVKKVFEIV